ncbi:TetR/AcrR family transcriptional regulator [Labilibaculum sp.]|uniref:TetR/AcrR family transcriptional regulator n=1 Tax=Labilibaculum sp. TaxID=2060723 RepID=UPI003568DBB1
MARQKAYNEKEVIEKATELFWNNGYESTSMSLLEKAMGINKFSIYASFGSKQGVFIESLKCYKNKAQDMLTKLKKSPKGKEAIQEFFYDFLLFSKASNLQKGCLLTNTSAELGSHGNAEIMAEIASFTKELKSIFAEKLAKDTSKSQELISKQANFLIIAKQGLSNASKVFDRSDLEDFIETTFENI